MEIVVGPEPLLRWNARAVRCALGRGGISAAKREGDGITPAGLFPLRRVLYRADCLPAPATRLPCQPITRNDGWCDDPGHADYNRPVALPHPARHEILWRADRLYDVILVIGHNDDPVRPGAGSAIFVHVAAPDYAATEGCVALALPDLLELLACCGAGDRIRVNAPRR